MAICFEKIYKDYFEEVFRYALSLCRNELIAEEITQETFFKALQNVDKFNGSCTLYTWLCQIAKNTYFTVYTKEKRVEPSDAAISQSQSYLDIERNFLDKDTTRKLHILLHNLSEPYKEVFSLRVFGELTFSQIGEIFEKTDGWARLTFYRAKNKLQEGFK